MIVSIEGMDGSGKSTISKLVAEKINYKYIEKPLKIFLNLSDLEYETLCQKIYLLNNNLKALFFGFNNLLAMQLNKENIILDKHILSTYFWNNTELNDELFDFFVNAGVSPNLTIILYSSIENRIRHIKFRNSEDKDLLDKKKMSFGYDKMIYFAEKSGLPYILINGDELSIDEIVDKIISIINDCSKLNKENIREYCNNKNVKCFKRIIK